MVKLRTGWWSSRVSVRALGLSLWLCLVPGAPSGRLFATGGTCSSTSKVYTAACWRTRTDAELLQVLVGTPGHPLAFPVVCGQTVETPEEARHILAGSRYSPCDSFRREALAMMFNLRLSLLFGDNKLGDEPGSCFCLGAICPIVLRCGTWFVPNPGTPDPNDALTLSSSTPIKEFLIQGEALCAQASCPPTSSSTCGKTLEAVANALGIANQCWKHAGACVICPGDTTPPTLHCPTGTLEVECTGPGGAVLEYPVTADDNCDPVPQLSCTPPPGTVLPLGTTRRVECKAKDAVGLFVYCEFKVKVVDHTPPRIVCPTGPIRVDCVENNPGSGAVVNYPPPVVTDLCDTTPSAVCSPPPGSLFPFGATTVTCTATDDSGNRSQCSFVVEVVEATPPTLICPGDITVECSNPDGEVITFPEPMLSSTCDAPTSLTCTPPSGSTFPPGTTQVTCRARTAGGRDLTCTFNVTVRDTQRPTLTCPGDFAVECSSPAGTPVIHEVTATDACDPDPVITCDPPSGSLFPPGETVVRCRARDASGNVDECAFRVVVRDTTRPILTCPTGPIVTDCTVLLPTPHAVVHYPAPSVEDNCDDSVQVTCAPPSGSSFPLGTTTVVCTAIDASGNRETCSFEVHVVDSAPPMLVCPGTVFAECTGASGAVVTFPAPVVADDCDGNPVVTCTPPSGSFFPMGDTTVVCTARDASGNTMRCEFTVTVQDTMAPGLACPPFKIAECEGPAGTVVIFDVGVADDCDPAPTVTCTPPSGSLFPPGVTEVTCIAQDAHGNTSSCTFEVNVLDTRPPVIECPQPIVAECQSSLGTPVSFVVSALDVCEDRVSLVCFPPSGSLFLPGTTEVVCDAVDASGNRSSCSFTVTIADTRPPALVCPDDLVILKCDLGSPTTPARYPAPSALDLCDEAPVVECTPAPGTPLGPGAHTVTCTAIDASGNRADCSFQIEVQESGAPALNCPSDITVSCEGPDGAAVTYPLPTPADACDPATNLVCLPPSGSVFPVGETTVVCTADDRDGNMIQCSFKIRVVDTTPPVIQCPGDLAVDCTSSQGAVVTFTVTATDGCDPSPDLSCVPPSGSTFPPGTTRVVCTARDGAGNTSECSFEITVRDRTPPSIACPASFETACMTGGSAVVNYPAPQVSDDCDPGPVVVCDPPSGSSLGLGPHRIVCTARDAAGNTSTCEFTITVVEATTGELICPANVSVECSSPDGTPVEFSTPVATDACAGQPEVTCVPPSGSLFPPGANEVVCTARDPEGNTLQCTFLVQVTDTTAPELRCPAEIIATCTRPEGAVVTYSPAVSDNCDRNPFVECVPPSGSVFPPGRTTVTCTAVDASGNRSECTFVVNVEDQTPPTLSCPGDVIVSGTTAGTNPHKPPGWPPGHLPPPNAITASVVFEQPSATDACEGGEVAVTCDPPNGTRLGFGTHTVTCTARDAAGNTATCTFQVTVVLGERAFIRSDSNGDGSFDIADPVYTINYLFTGGPPPRCDDAADVNDDGQINLTDSVYALNYQFRGGPVPPPPYAPLCGLDPTVDVLGCARYLPCE